MRPFLALLFVGAILAGCDRNIQKANAAPAAKPAPQTVKIPPNPFAWAIQDQSTGNSYVLVTIVDDRTGTSRQCCVTSRVLVDAVMTEKHRDFSLKTMGQSMTEIIANKSRTYHFSDSKTLGLPIYSDDLLASVREHLAPYTSNQLFQRFRADSTYAFYRKFGKPDEREDALNCAVAQVLLEHGFFVNSGDFFDGVHVYTVQDIEIAQRMYDAGARQIKEAKIKGKQIARNMPGYGEITKYFTISSPYYNKFELPSATFDCCLTRPGSFLVGDARWTTPVVAYKPLYSWRTFLKNYHAASRIANRQPWLALWKRQCHGSISFTSFGGSTHGGPDDMTGATKAWRKGGLTGSPRFQYDLSMPHNGNGSVYLDATGRQALVYSADDPEGYLTKEDPEYKSPARPVPKSKSEQQRLGVRFRPVPPTLKGYQEYYVVASISAHRRLRAH